MTDFDWPVIVRAWPFFVEGMALSALLVVVATLGGIIVGAFIAWMRQSRWPVLSVPAAVYVTTMRSVPLILVLFWFYFLVPLAIGRPIGSLAAALTAFVLFEAAFYCEIIRAGIGSVRSGQMQIALATGMRTSQAMRLVILPQALRAMVPLFLNQIIIVFQDTSLVYVVSLSDFLTAASIVASRDGRPVEIYSFVALVYLLICFGASTAFSLGKNRAIR